MPNKSVLLSPEGNAFVVGGSLHANFIRLLPFLRVSGTFKFGEIGTSVTSPLTSTSRVCFESCGQFGPNQHSGITKRACRSAFERIIKLAKRLSNQMKRSPLTLSTVLGASMSKSSTP